MSRPPPRAPRSADSATTEPVAAPVAADTPPRPSLVELAAAQRLGPPGVAPPVTEPPAIQTRLLRCTVDGRRATFAVGSHLTLLEALRGPLGVTVPKQGCDAGECGSCTVWVDGEPMLSCLTLAANAQGRDIHTAASLGRGGALASAEAAHPLVESFHRHGAAQCGFCTPGMLMSAAALLRDHAEAGDGPPTRAEIRAALGGNLCRCTGYMAIFDAVAEAAAANANAPTGAAGVPTDAAGTRPAPLPGRAIDDRARMLGTIAYTDDLALPGACVVKFLRSPHAHAELRSIDVREARALPGVIDVLLGAELPTRYGVIPWTQDETALAVGVVRYVGEAVAAVAAHDEETANAALQRIVVDYKPLEALDDPHDALGRSDVLVHGDARRGNVTKEVALAFGDVDAGLRDAALTIEGDYSFHGTTHAALEPHAAMAQLGPDGLLTVWSSTQVPHYLRLAICRVLDLPQRRVRVIQPAVGGAFGGKSEPFDLELAVAALALRTGRPMRCTYTRQEVFYAHRGRHPFDMRYRMGLDADGQILAVDADLVLDGGAYASFGLVTTYYAGQLLGAPYTLGAYRFRSRRASTHKPACGPKRGHGSVQPRFAMEVQLDKAAVALGRDPIDYRRRLFCGEHTTTVNGFAVRTSGLLACLDAVEAASGWKQRRGRLGDGHGLGVAVSTYISGTNYAIVPDDQGLPQSAVQIALDRSGRVRISAGVSEIGQGTHTMLARMAAAELGVEPEDVRIVAGDTDLCPVDLGAYSSRITVMAGTACQRAARQLAAQIRAVLAERWACDADDVVLADRRAALRPEAAAPTPPADDTQACERRDGVAIERAFRLTERKLGSLAAIGSYDTPRQGVHGDYRGGTIGASPVYSYTAHVVEARVDRATGDVEVVQVWAAHDCGKAISPVQVQGQIVGSVAMGLGEALLEHHQVLAHGLDTSGGPRPRRAPGPGVPGLLRTDSLLGYALPTAMDAPEIAATIVECPDPLGPSGAREAGEGPLHPALPALANAVFDAVGVRVDHLPLTPERVLAALHDQRGWPC